MTASEHHTQVRFLQVLHSQIVEKILRFEAFLKEAQERTRAGRSFNVVNSLRNSLSKRKADLFKIATHLNTSPGTDSNMDDVDSYLRILLTQARDLNLEHQHLRWVYSPWPEEQTASFLALVFSQHSEYESIVTKTKGSIVFADDCNFWKYEARRMPSGEYSQADFEIRLFCLPKIEKNNPLLWPVLVHEVAHAILSRDEYAKEISDLINTNLPYGRFAVTLRWFSEIGSDLIALNLVGPAYSFALLQVFSELQGNLHHASDLGPAPAYRAQLWMDTLELEGRSNPLPKEHYIRQAFDFIDERNKLDARNQHGTAEAESKEQKKRFFPLADSYEEAREEIVRVVSDFLRTKQLLPGTYGMDRLETHAHLAENLEMEVPISSDRNSTQIDNARSILVRAESSEQTPTRCMIRELSSLLAEKPCDVTDIVNAGWLHKCKSRDRWINERLSRVGLDLQMKQDEFYEEYRNSLYRADLLLLKSIEVRQVHAFFNDIHPEDRSYLWKD